MKKMQLALFITAFIIVGALAVPAYAQTTISGTIPFDPSNYNGVTSVTQLTINVIYQSGVAVKTNPKADGTFSVTVPGNGTYSFTVTPSKLDYVNKTTNANYSIFYPDNVANIFIKAVPDAGLTGVVIPAMYISYPTISGTIPFDPDNYNSVNNVTQLTIYAYNQSGFAVKTNPKADGTFSMKVVGNGTYSFKVIPYKLDYMNKTTNATYSIFYPNDSAPFNVSVPDQGLSGVEIATQYEQTGAPMNATPLPPSLPPVTPTPSPGFTMIAALAALGAMTAIAYRKH